MSPSNPASALVPHAFAFLLLLPSVAVLSAGFEERNITSIPQCYSGHCGDGVEIRYPLWLYNETETSYCGYPNLGITCQEGHPVLKLGADSYRISGVDNGTSIITVQDMDLLGSTCPRARHNLSLEGGVPLSGTESDVRLVFLFNCSGNFPEENQLRCLGELGGNRSYVFLEREIPVDWNLVWGSCQDIVEATVLKSGIEALGRNLTSLFFAVLRRGFQLAWQPPDSADCRICERSGGKCGYQYSKGVGEDGFHCLCEDGRYNRDCSSDGKKNNRKIIIGICAGFGGFLLASVIFFFLYRHKKVKARLASSNLLFQTASSEPSSKKDPELGSTHYPTHVFRYEELHEATNGFSQCNELGDGGFGTVYKGKLRDGRVVAVKRLYESNYKRVEQFLNEVAILNRLRHQNLVTLYGCTSRHSRELLLVYEFVPNGTVADHLHGNHASEGALTWPIRLSIAVETATALAYLHAVEPQIIHRDVKTNNILLDNNFHVKVADFGLSRLFPMDVTHVSTAPQGTPGYVDPEYHQCYQLTDKSDVYSFGVVLVELISSKPAVDITRHRHEINLANMAINKIQGGALHELVDPALGFETDWEVRRMIKLAAELAFRCLQGEKEMRPSMEDVLEVLQGIQDCHDPAERPGNVDQGTADDMSLLKNNVPVSPDSVMDKWTSRTTTPNTSG